jgi:transposase-like protein|tara:strand:+ start:127 stop:612 length:486 start_codon:yes stop_codon:yes gene_type:complete
MVSEALSSQPDFEPQIIEFAQQRSHPDHQRKQTLKYLCPRCSTKLIIGYDEPECSTCGYVDYEYEPHVKNDNRSILSSATKFILRYIGDFENLSNTTANVKVIRIKNRVVYSVECPFCSNPMEQSSLSGKRAEMREQRYKCEKGHRVSLLPNKKHKGLGWK